nr:NADH dehydrogenase subunit 1 [Eurycercus lamellatus]
MAVVGCLIILIVGVLVGVAFFTLFERKLLGYIQLRKGPNKVGFTGVLQPFADAVKLFTKEHVSPSYSNYISFFLSPVVSLSLSLIVWGSVSSNFNLISFESSILFFLCCVGLNIYSMLAGGWSSNSKYSLLGALRGVAQTISYEVSLVLVLLCPILVTLGYKWSNLNLFQESLFLFWVFPLSGAVWFISCLAETNRTPFDFAEGESELVSGYNTEYSSAGFSLLMLAEYSSILFMSFITVLLFFGGSLMLFQLILFMGVGYLFVWVRGTLPRFRYDKLMLLAWKNFLPFSIIWLVLSGSLVILLF